ncbi:MAG: GIY-YIG nuclease family protein [Bacteroidales bacterium]|nr:GIY-YIG nuclease family protein [Bacteroidales bacterium]
MFYIYILYSSSADKYYVGHSNDPIRRLEEHNNNPRNTFTKKFGPWEIKAFFKVHENRGDAMKIEKYIKKQKSRLFIERLLNEPDFFELIAQLVRVPIDRD